MEHGAWGKPHDYKSASTCTARGVGAPTYGILLDSCTDVAVKSTTMTGITGGAGAKGGRYGSACAGGSASGIGVMGGSGVTVSDADISSIAGGNGGYHFVYGSSGSGGDGIGLYVKDSLDFILSDSKIHDLDGGTGTNAGCLNWVEKAGAGGNAFGVWMSGANLAQISTTDVYRLTGGNGGDGCNAHDGKGGDGTGLYLADAGGPMVQNLLVYNPMPGAPGHPDNAVYGNTRAISLSEVTGLELYATTLAHGENGVENCGVVAANSETAIRNSIIADFSGEALCGTGFSLSHVAIWDALGVDDWWVEGTMVVAADPQFVSAISGNYHLATGSGLIDLGEVEELVGEEPSPNGGRLNLGRYAGTSEATTSNCTPGNSSCFNLLHRTCGLDGASWEADSDQTCLDGIECTEDSCAPLGGCFFDDQFCPPD